MLCSLWSWGGITRDESGIFIGLRPVRTSLRLVRRKYTSQTHLYSEQRIYQNFNSPLASCIVNDWKLLIAGHCPVNSAFVFPAAFQYSGVPLLITIHNKHSCGSGSCTVKSPDTFNKNLYKTCPWLSVPLKQINLLIFRQYVNTTWCTCSILSPFFVYVYILCDLRVWNINIFCQTSVNST